MGNAFDWDEFNLNHLTNSRVYTTSLCYPQLYRNCDTNQGFPYLLSPKEIIFLQAIFSSR